RLVTLAGADPESEPLTFKVSSLAAHGTLYHGTSTALADKLTFTPIPLSGNQVTYVPDANFNSPTGTNGPDSFGFKTNDGASDSAPGTETVVVDPVNDGPTATPQSQRSEEHTSELQSRGHLVCRLLLDKKNN